MAERKNLFLILLIIGIVNIYNIEPKDLYKLIPSDMLSVIQEYLNYFGESNTISFCKIIYPNYNLLFEAFIRTYMSVKSAPAKGSLVFDKSEDIDGESNKSSRKNIKNKAKMEKTPEKSKKEEVMEFLEKKKVISLLRKYKNDRDIEVLMEKLINSVE